MHACTPPPRNLWCNAYTPPLIPCARCPVSCVLDMQIVHAARNTQNSSARAHVCFTTRARACQRDASHAQHSQTTYPSHMLCKAQCLVCVVARTLCIFDMHDASCVGNLAWCARAVKWCMHHTARAHPCAQQQAADAARRRAFFVFTFAVEVF